VEQQSKAKDVFHWFHASVWRARVPPWPQSRPMDRWRLQLSHPQHAPANLSASPQQEREQKDDEPRGATIILASTTAVEVKLFS
jgi:hypothetical protein